jgi:tetratricopeptide (TPR) repeat protein
MVIGWYAMFLGSMGRHDEALIQAERARELDPVSPIVGMILSRVYYWHHDFDQAIEGYQRIIELDPQYASAHSRLGMTYLAKGSYGDAVHEFEEAQRLSASDPYLEALLAYARAARGQSDKARITAADLTRRSSRKYVPALSIALVHIGLGDHDQALEWLSRCYEDRSTHMVYAKVDPLLDPIRSDPRFWALLKQMGL